MQFGNPIAVEDLIANFVGQLQKNCGIPQDSVFETLATDEDHCEFPPADRFITIQPQRFSRLPGAFAGGGRYLEGYDSTWRVACICRFASDQEWRNTRELRSKTRSALSLNARVIDSLDGWQMPDPTNTFSPLTEPVGNRDFDVRPKRIKQTAWAAIVSTWSVKFVLALQSGTVSAP